ncbi:ABC transporter permease [Actinoallomurus iriomotensis]|uniref:Sugar ABC transporter permease n=1 Tax=Actinoallomurus iriomotensis TaxID=478107 RepID=A0A9W6VPR5_9ACTN|nr:ABC transporter permease [Actinoallomurus iriomotensis]GLY80228.1 sugar ABC transporter permease [Actinoallomurus iriomotensis]
MTTETAAVPASRFDRARLLAWLQDYGVYAAIAALILVNIAITPRFLTLENLRTQLVQVAPVVIVSFGMALVIGTEGVDLSVGSVMALTTALIPLYLGYGVVPAVVAGLLGGVAVGLVNGSLVAFVGVQPIVATLALFVGGRGIALVVAGGQLKDVHDQTLLDLGSSSLAGIPLPVVVAAVLTVVVMAVVRRTTFGRRLVAIGGNRTASELSGLPVRRVLLLVYVVSGLLAAVAGTLATARLQASDPSSLGLLMELSAITAVVVGGTPLNGGRVRVLGTVAGALLIQLVRATLIKHDLADSIAQMVQAVIILAAVYAARGAGRR